MNITARADYAIEAVLTLAHATAEEPDRTVPADAIAERADIPRKFLESILRDLRRAGIVSSTRGSRGGYVLALPPEEIHLGSIVRAVDGPLAQVRGRRPQHTSYSASATHLSTVWVAVRASLRQVLDRTTIADVLSGELPAHVVELANQDDAWENR
ncbi:RrF2 family transcriptional regulator [Piscicoccus intestinalis]|uniref:RrF2 family transcriptional regulator n=1 Tax=Piscicoccus intestinalis TaxID=746033 RepID=UPI00083888F2|nr:Rrf2 family transcriptional regulator [Piscicoccus intestinalis]